VTTPYCTKDQWAKRKARTDWATYDAATEFPDEGALDDALEDATEIINDTEHIGCKSTNITDSAYTARLERICYDMANRILMLEQNQGYNAGNWTYSPQDYMNTRERNFLIEISIDKGYRVVGGVST
jgi:hypothetical protein